MRGVTQEMDDLRLALGEVDALSIVTSEVYDREDWIRPDSVLVERVASLLGLIVKSADAAMAAFHRLQGAVADAAPVPAEACECWDYEGEGTAQGRDPVAVQREDDAIAKMKQRR